MQKFVKYVMSMVLASLFLVSFTGIRLLMHHCLACDSSALYLFADVSDCCAQDSCSINTDSINSCCTTEDTHFQCENCCEDEVLYVKNDYEISKDRQIGRLQPVLVGSPELTLSSQIIQPVFADESSSLFSNTDPPPRKVAREFVLFAHQLKIC